MNSITTEQPNVLHRLIGERDVYLTLDEYVQEQAETMERILNNALDMKKIDEFSYRRLIGEVKNCATWDNAFDHYGELFKDMSHCMREHLLSRIVAGAEYIEEIGTDHPHYEAAMKKYDNLCAELHRADGWMQHSEGSEEIA